MVKVAAGTYDQSTAWRVRDGTGEPSLLGGATACITVFVDADRVVLKGWTLDEYVLQVAMRVAVRSAGRRPVQSHLHAQPIPNLRPINHRPGTTDAA